jgi:hypothetical protein
MRLTACYFKDRARGELAMKLRFFGFCVVLAERIRTDSIGGPSWAIKYKITFTEEQLANLHPDLSSANVDVTAFVRQGQLTIR